MFAGEDLYADASDEITSKSQLVQRLGKLALKPVEAREQRLAERAINALGLVTLGESPDDIFNEVHFFESRSLYTLCRCKTYFTRWPR